MVYDTWTCFPMEGWIDLLMSSGNLRILKRLLMDIENINKFTLFWMRLNNIKHYMYKHCQLNLQSVLSNLGFII